MDLLDLLYDLDNTLEILTAFAGVMGILFSLLTLALSVFAYFLYGYPQAVISDKTYTGNRWMAFVPIARSIQKTQIAEMPTWQFMFLGWFTPLCLAILVLILSAGMHIFVFGAILVFAIAIAALIFNYVYKYKLCVIFGFKTLLALVMLLIPMYGVIFEFLIVYSDKYPANKSALRGDRLNFGAELRKIGGEDNRYYSPQGAQYQPQNRQNPNTAYGSMNNRPQGAQYQPQNRQNPNTAYGPMNRTQIIDQQPSRPQPNPNAVYSPMNNRPQNINKTEFIINNTEHSNGYDSGIAGTMGEYTGRTFKIENGGKLIIGRSREQCNVIMPDSSKKISRVHCSIEFNPANNTYSVLDESSNGTFINGSRIPQGRIVSAKSGDSISFGDDENTFVFK